MKPKLCLRFFSMSAFACTVAFGAGAKDSREITAPKKKPELHIDPTAVSDGKPLVVTSYADVLEPVQKAVVSIYSTKIVKERVRISPFFRPFFGDIPDQERSSKLEGLGSGVIVSADGYILTNNHVVEGADELKVTLSDDRDFIAKVVGADPKTDIAVIKIEAEKLPMVTLADSDKLRVGDVVFALGNPLNIGQTVTMGIISARGRNKIGLLESVGGYEDFIQTDAAINMGNSGGALVDAKGRLVGVNSAIYSPTQTNIGIGFAVPVNLAASVMNSLIATGKVVRGFLGVVPFRNPMTPDVAEQLGLPKGSKGVVVDDLDPGSPAEKAGLKRRDVILGINDHPVTAVGDLRFLIAQLMPGSKAKLKISRDGKERTIEVTLGELVDNPDEFIAGVNAVPLTAEARRKLSIRDNRIAGLLVTEVADDSPFSRQLAVNMVIREINGIAATDLATAKESLKEPGVGNLLAVYYQGRAGLLPLVIPAR